MNLQELRQNLGLSRSVVAMLSGVSIQRLANFEQGTGILTDSDFGHVRKVLLQFVSKRAEQVEKLRAEIVGALKDHSRGNATTP
jgi:transcriptional regulator with XRE-family HTH domain